MQIAKVFIIDPCSSKISLNLGIPHFPLRYVYFIELKIKKKMKNRGI